MRNRRCTNEQCSFVHLKGTVREARKPQESPLQQRGTNMTKPIHPKVSEDCNARNSFFLKLEKLIVDMNTSFQQQITQLQCQMDVFLRPSWQAPRQQVYSPAVYSQQTYSPRHQLASQEVALNYPGMPSPDFTQTMVGHVRDLNPRSTTQ